ncbi:DUF533 domain-containing protein [uncultured Desulfobulbus sp.]|uniref:DUF533 domain-containing protein n=1 Tax=uncultured Desulfobulbus sp. TaxID=239745 RepID=UPI0029C74559|nr:DUF533 domain-containing protein [uncultured Desulfobulbus sp.]
MFDAEKLLGKIVGEVVGKGSGSWGGGNKSILGSLGSGSGLMTMIGLGVGAFEILKQQQEQKSQTGGMGQAPPPPPGSGSFGTGAPPPPPGGFQATAPSPPPPMPSGAPVISSPMSAPATGGLAGAELAVRMIQVMVAAAHADGAMDAEEERAVLDKLRGADLNQEEKMFLLGELHQPKSLEALTAGVSDPSVAKTMYMLAVAAIEIDSEAERAWLNELARQLGVSREIQAFIEEQR